MTHIEETAGASTTERAAFSNRLKQALANAHHKPSPTQLSREFNLRYAGHPVTVHAARKWLVGEAIPTQAKLRAIADWLGVTTHWLRFGDATDTDRREKSEPFESDDLRMMADIARLDDHHKALAREFIRVLVRANGKDSLAVRANHWQAVESGIARLEQDNAVASKEVTKLLRKAVACGGAQ